MNILNEENNRRRASKIIKYLEQRELDLIYGELEENKDSLLWASHSGPPHILLSEKDKYAAARHGQTFWLHYVDNVFERKLDQTQFFLKTVSIIKQLAGSNALGRVYWHKLKPGLAVEEHTDSSVYFDQVLHRYQIHLSMPAELKIFMDGNLHDPKTFENCILDFNFSRPHYYFNESKSMTFLTLVADVLHPQIKVISMAP